LGLKDAGHGGSDNGASGNGIIEKEYTLKISKYIADRLKDLGVNVKMTRDTDETISPTERVNRVKNAFGDTSDVVVISNHINAGGGEGSCGKLTFFEIKIKGLSLLLCPFLIH
jgi:N-acetylmuramoyl-L-alanine amidase